MPRTLGSLAPEERVAVVTAIHSEAEAAGWHKLSNVEKGFLYNRWAEDFDLARQAIKDGIMKGFDVAQGIPATGEAAIQDEVLAVLVASPVPYSASKISLWGGRAQADFAIGYSPKVLTHTIELEPAPTWRNGLMQALWYKSAYFHESGIQAIPTVILFGNLSAARWAQVQTTCLDQRAQVLGHRLSIDGAEPNHTLDILFSATR